MWGTFVHNVFLVCGVSVIENGDVMGKNWKI